MMMTVKVPWQIDQMIFFMLYYRPQTHTVPCFCFLHSILWRWDEGDGLVEHPSMQDRSVLVKSPDDLNEKSTVPLAFRCRNTEQICWKPPKLRDLMSRREHQSLQSLFSQTSPHGLCILTGAFKFIFTISDVLSMYHFIVFIKFTKVL